MFPFLNPNISYFAETNFREERKLFGMYQKDRLFHTAIFGKTGAGKTTLIETLILQDIVSNRGIFLVDIHGDMSTSLLKQIPENRKKDLVYINLSDSNLQWKYNPLRTVPYEKRSLVASHILDTLKKNRNDPWRLEQLYRLCSTQKDFDSLRPFLIQILDILLVRTQDQEAINLLKHYYKAMPEYALDDPELSFKLAQVAYHLHDYKVIIRLLKDFHKRYGDYVKIPEAYILLAKTLANGLRMKDKAKAYLGYLVKNYPEHDNQPLFQEMLTTVSQGKRL